MIDQGLHLFYKSQRVPQLGVAVECGFIFPAGVDVEESGILGCAESVDGEATGFLPRWPQDFVDSGGDFVVKAFFGMEAAEDK